MEQAFQFRFKGGDQGTFSKFLIPNINWESYVLEPPWRDNKTNISCIPANTYIVQPRLSPKYGWTFHVTDVQGRKYILLHSGNFGGDVSKGWKTHTMGCHLHGSKIGYLGTQLAVLNSRITINELVRKLNLQPFKLTIKWLF